MDRRATRRLMAAISIPSFFPRPLAFLARGKKARPLRSLWDAADAGQRR